MRRPLTGAILGFLIGLALAVVLQQQGVWPLDQILVFLIPGITGVIGLLLLTVGREGATVSYVIAIILLVPALVWGAMGLSKVSENGQLNGGCMVQSNTSVPDQTVVTDTSRSDPYKVDPKGSLHWEAASPTIFMDYDWEMWVELGGIAVPFDDGHEGNEGGSPANFGDIANVEAYAQSVGVDISQLRGVFMVGGFASTCDGFGFLVLVADGLTLPSIISLIVLLILLIILIILVFKGRGAKDIVASSTVAAAGAGGATNGGPIPGDTDGDGDVDLDDLQNQAGGDEPPGPAAEIAAGAAAAGYGRHISDPTVANNDLDDEDRDEIDKAGDQRED